MTEAYAAKINTEPFPYLYYSSNINISLVIVKSQTIVQNIFIAPSFTLLTVK